MPAPIVPDRIQLAPGFTISRIVTGLWQVADMERGGTLLDPDKASDAMLDYVRAGFDTFDMADHYGSAEVITGRMLARVRAGELGSGPAHGPDPAISGSDQAMGHKKPRHDPAMSGSEEVMGHQRHPVAFTKWCPAPGPMPLDVVRDGVRRSLDRMGLECIDLMQFHWWSFEHLAWLDALKGLAQLREEGLIRHIGLTNFDTAHLRVLVKHGIPIATNQVCFSLLDRRAGAEMSAFCLENGVRLLAYGTLAGGLMSEKWLGASEPGADDIADWSKMKYKRFVDAIGGWSALQAILMALKSIADKHRVSLPNVATRWVLEHPAVAATIVGARLGESEHRADNLQLFAFALDADDHALIDKALEKTTMLAGDCGDEYRKPPFLTASGDLSHHLETMPKFYTAEPVQGRADRWRVSSGSQWEPIAGYSRSVRISNRILVSGTTATNGAGEMVAPGDAAAQTTFILDKIAAGLAALGATLDDVVRTRVYLAEAEDCEAVSRAHGRYFGDIRPANTLIEVSRLIGDYKVEIEAEAIVDN